MRHTFFTNCHSANIPIKYVQEWAGHADIKTTLNVYTHTQKKGTSILLKYVNKLAKTIIDTKN